MKIGSLVVPTIDYKEGLDTPHISFEGIIPNPETICEVIEIYDNRGDQCIKVQESRCFYYDIECGFIAKYWREIKEETSLEGLLEEIEEHMCVPLL